MIVLFLIIYYMFFMKKIVIYDLDYTIISINSLSLFISYLFQLKPKKIFFMPFLLMLTLLWMLGIITAEYVKSKWLVLFKGMTENELEKFSRDFTYKYIIPKIKEKAILNINDYKKKNYIIIIASASFEVYVKYIAEYLKADYHFGTKITIEDNKVVTKIDGYNCKGKEKIKRILKKISMDMINKKESAAYSDSRSDLPFLDLADKFYLVSRKKWKILKTFYNN